MPLLSELPSDSTKRDLVLDSSAQTAGPEQRKGMTAKERKAETAAATAAAILGEIFSHTKSVTLGAATTFDATEVLAPQPMPRTRPPAGAGDTGDEGDAAKPNAPDDVTPSNADLIPWIKLK